MAFLASVSQFLGKTFALWVLVFAGLAYVSPDSFKFFAPYISRLLGIIMFGIGLTLKASDFSEVFRRPMAVAIGTLGQFTIMPILAWLLCLIFNLPPDIAHRARRGRHARRLLPRRYSLQRDDLSGSWRRPAFRDCFLSEHHSCSDRDSGIDLSLCSLLD